MFLENQETEKMEKRDSRITVAKLMCSCLKWNQHHIQAPLKKTDKKTPRFNHNKCLHYRVPVTGIYVKRLLMVSAGKKKFIGLQW